MSRQKGERGRENLFFWKGNSKSPHITRVTHVRYPCGILTRDHWRVKISHGVWCLIWYNLTPSSWVLPRVVRNTCEVLNSLCRVRWLIRYTWDLFLGFREMIDMLTSLYSVGESFDISSSPGSFLKVWPICEVLHSLVLTLSRTVSMCGHPSRVTTSDYSKSHEWIGDSIFLVF